MKRSLEERLAPLVPAQAFRTIRQQTLGEFFRAVGQMTHLVYPVRRLEQIEEDGRITEACSYERAYILARQDAASADWQKEGERLMAQLLIEPFAAIHEMLKEDENHDRI